MRLTVRILFPENKKIWMTVIPLSFLGIVDLITSIIVIEETLCFNAEVSAY